MRWEEALLDNEYGPILCNYYGFPSQKVGEKAEEVEKAGDDKLEDDRELEDTITDDLLSMLTEYDQNITGVEGSQEFGSVFDDFDSTPIVDYPSYSTSQATTSAAGTIIESTDHTTGERNVEHKEDDVEQTKVEDEEGEEDSSDEEKESSDSDPQDEELPTEEYFKPDKWEEARQKRAHKREIEEAEWTPTYRGTEGEEDKYEEVERVEEGEDEEVEESSDEEEEV